MAKREPQPGTEPPAPPPRAPSLRDLIGQDRALGVLRAAAASGRVHHAWIFTGPFGVGKRTAAEAFAAMLLDPTTAPNLAGELEPDPDSPTQAMIARGTHPDLHVITKELAVFADDKAVRSAKQTTIPKAVIEKHLLQPMALAPTIRAASRVHKAFIIDEAELMDRSRTNAPVQNSILKTLEEPSPGSVVILVTAGEDMLLPTIRSRCQRVVFGPLDGRAMAEWYARSGLALAEDERRWVLEFAAGSPGRALLAARTGLYRWAARLEPMLAAAERGAFSPELGHAMKELVGEWAEERVRGNPNASKEAANLAAIRHLLAIIGERLRRRVRARVNESGAAACAGELRALDALTSGERLLTANTNAEMSLEVLSVGLAAAGR